MLTDRAPVAVVPPPEAEAPSPAVDPGLTARSFVVAVLFTVLAALWIRQAEIIVLSALVSSSIPALPGLAALVFLLPVNAILRLRDRGQQRRSWGGTDCRAEYATPRRRRLAAALLRPFTHGELLVVFLFVTVGSTVMGVGVQRRLIGLLSAPLGASPVVQQRLPGWLMPRGETAVRQLFQRAPDGRVPWEAWWAPSLWWLGFLLALWWCLYCLMALCYRRWSQEERLAFPLVHLPLAVVGDASGPGGFFRSPAMWVGFALSAGFNGVNILHAFCPSVPSLGQKWDLSAAFPALPWSALTPLEIQFQPTLIGLGFLMPAEISLTAWLAFVAEKLVAVYGASLGYPPTGDATYHPWMREQAFGAYLVLAAVIVWRSRRSVTQGRAALGFIGGFGAVWWFMTAAGMAWWVALAYLLLVVAVALVYARLRAEAGSPSLWLWPWFLQKEALLYTFGSHPFVVAGPATLPVWALFSFLASGTFPTLAAYQVEGMELSRRRHIPARRLAAALGLAVVVGFGVGWVLHLALYYQRGAQQLPNGAWAARRAALEYEQAAGYLRTNRLPDFGSIRATGAGAAVAILLALLRLRCAGFPLHPLGYAMAGSAGSTIWSAFLLVWLIKAPVLRWGGMHAYRRLIPFFLGFALGHLAVGGIFWGLLAAWAGDAAGGYQVYFG